MERLRSCTAPHCVRHSKLPWILLATLSCLYACSSSVEVETRQAAQPLAKVQAPPEDPRPPAQASKTALISLLLSSDGTARISEARIKPISFRTPSAGPGLAPAGDLAMVLRAEAGGRVVELPIDLGPLEDLGGDVVSKWKGGGVILRAPYFGQKTRYTVGPRGGAPLAMLEVEEH